MKKINVNRGKDKESREVNQFIINGQTLHEQRRFIYLFMIING